MALTAVAGSMVYAEALRCRPEIKPQEVLQDGQPDVQGVSMLIYTGAFPPTPCRTLQETEIDALLTPDQAPFRHRRRRCAPKHRTGRPLGKDKQGVLNPMPKEPSTRCGAHGLSRRVRPVESGRQERQRSQARRTACPKSPSPGSDCWPERRVYKVVDAGFWGVLIRHGMNAA